MIVSLTPEQSEEAIGQLVDLLIDAVDSGASIGFMPPIGKEEALAYWRDVIAAMRTGRRLLLAAMDGDLVQGSVQMDLEPRANGNHRAEVIKLFVHRRARRRGLAKALILCGVHLISPTFRNIMKFNDHGRPARAYTTRPDSSERRLCRCGARQRLSALCRQSRDGRARR